MSIEGKLCEYMGYDRAIPFPRARDALAAWCLISEKKIPIPSNCCPSLVEFSSKLVPVSRETGLAPIPVHMYGYRAWCQEPAELEIDPLMTGLFVQPTATSTIVSFGYGKTIDIGGGGAILTNDIALADELVRFAYFPPVLAVPLEWALETLHKTIMEKKIQYEEIENRFAPFVERLPGRPVVPWRFVAKKFRSIGGQIITTKRPGDVDWQPLDIPNGYKVSHNYPPLPGVTDPGAIEWGEKVINIWR